ncbi:SGNH/GDSL hydrolase family protein [Kribbella ginsengisoli]|uniref:SGNH/GDSL hydrolase family protein n=1 Tax=Kribbella ginsengisoli TaxID=363865 RepID=UPI0031DB1C29
MRRRREVMVAAVVALLAVGAAGGAYASGSVPYALMSDGVRNDAWVKKHCAGPALGRPAKCPQPGHAGPGPLPVGDGGTMVSFGDSFSAGEGAPSTDQYKIITRGQFDLRLADCNAFERSCLRVGTSKDRVWDGASGYYAGTDGGDGNTCHRSPEAYAPRVARELKLTLEFRACSGAVSGDYANSQDGRTFAQQCATAQCPEFGEAPQFPAGTKLVTAGFGGNNALFAQVVKVCIATGRSMQQFLRELKVDQETQADLLALKEVTNSDWTSCTPYTRKLIEVAAKRLGPELDKSGHLQPGVAEVVRDLKRRTPAGGRVILTSYPHLFPDGNPKACGVGTGEASMGKTEQAAINTLVDTINGVLRVAAAKEGVDFVDMTYAFVGRGVKAGSREDHGLCQDQGPDDKAGNGERWVNRFRFWNDWTDAKAKEGSMHPNVHGQAAYAERLLACYNDRTACDGTLDADRWRDQALRAIGCTLPPDEPDFKTNVWDKAAVVPRRLDVTGDGKPEAVVEAQCPSTTSSHPTEYAVFDDSTATPRVLGALGEEHYYRQATLTVEGKTVVVAGTSVGGKDPLCCADHVARDVYQWDGSKFRNLSSTETYPKEAPEKAAPGPVVDALITSVDAGRRVVTYDVVQWFSGKAAEKACKEDLVSSESEWCHDYYWRNANDLLRINSVLSVAKLEVVNQFGGSTWRPTTLQELATYAPASGAIYTLHIANNQIISIQERFTP